MEQRPRNTGSVTDGDKRIRRAVLACLAVTLMSGMGPARAIDEPEAASGLTSPLLPASMASAPALPPLSSPATLAPPAYPPPADLRIDLASTAALAPTRRTGELAERSAAPLSQEDLASLKAALEHYERGRIAEGDSQMSGVRQANALLAAEWAAIRSGSPAVSFARIERFLASAPAWLALPSVHKRAEEAMLSQRAPASRVIAFFNGREPVSGAGRAALAMALKQTEDHARADALARALWRDEPMGRELEATFLKAFEGVLKQADHRNRMEMQLFRENAEPALRSAARAGPEHVALAQARLAVARGSGGAAPALAAVPERLRADSSYVFALAQHHRRKKEADISAKLIAGLPRDAAILVDGDEWWVERRLIARQLLDKGLNAEAYAVAAGHSAEKAQSVIEAEWHAGWIALRFLNDAAKALPHFEEAARKAETPISTARAAYWRALALEALGRTNEAEAAFEAAARQPIAFYGQVARARLGLRDLPLRQAEATTPHDSLALVEALEAADQRKLAQSLMGELARTLIDGGALERLAAVAARVGDARLLVNIGKSAVQRGLPLDLTAYPVSGMPAFEPVGIHVERAMVFAIARQESAFDPRAVSSAGARGLMQMMVPTARETARRVGLGFEASLLTADPAYNARLGAAHLGDLLRDWRGSYILAFAAYNAGSGNVRDWIAAYGDPRLPGVDPIDWIERIPFTETRNYVQRVMENLQVYRARLGDHDVLMVANDLRRGRRHHLFAGEDLPLQE
jgi:soluble lytic murein transglycosylase